MMAAQPDFTRWMPIGADAGRDCIAPVEASRGDVTYCKALVCAIVDACRMKRRSSTGRTAGSPK
jgi:hypothetical protein